MVRVGDCDYSDSSSSDSSVHGACTDVPDVARLNVNSDASSIFRRSAD